MAITNYDVGTIFKSMSGYMNERGGNSLFTEKLKLIKNANYRFRLLPYTKGTKEEIGTKTCRHVEKFFWKTETGKWGSVVSLQHDNNGARCPARIFRERKNNSGTEREKQVLKESLSHAQNWYFNVYVIEDTANPDNVGKVKILPASKTVFDIIDGAFKGNLDSKFASFGLSNYHVAEHIFDINKGAVDLVIHVKPQAGTQNMNNYDDTTFLPSQVEVPVSALEQCHDLWALDPILSYEETEKRFLESYVSYYFGPSSSVVSSQTPTNFGTQAMSSAAIAAASQAAAFRPEPTPTPAVSINSNSSTAPEDVDDFIAQLGQKPNL